MINTMVVPMQVLQADLMVITKGMVGVDNYLKENPSGPFSAKLSVSTFYYYYYY